MLNIYVYEFVVHLFCMRKIGDKFPSNKLTNIKWLQSSGGTLVKLEFDFCRPSIGLNIVEEAINQSETTLVFEGQFEARGVASAVLVAGLALIGVCKGGGVLQQESV
ncbi:unnamed protein product [Cylindrotheca closterium]|uniref:Uncharacterized protein n=1 Tax=Cylindrotheca closterium TaxID=2856 RepID=A0AAD2FEP9_9STRA|nr:unnamed protein product [Cylindrotheca closterium]CAJ1935300.1 unnamed protein product [Cylindrotheca closterium]CAJ1935301.1 unnamed protein product [Cylindrotheca closterium]CAJ1935302.1 unnamed protein product [Cylindrotheca closterium]